MTKHLKYLPNCFEWAETSIILYLRYKYVNKQLESINTEVYSLITCSTITQRILGNGLFLQHFHIMYFTLRHQKIVMWCEMQQSNISISHPISLSHIYNHERVNISIQCSLDFSFTLLLYITERTDKTLLAAFWLVILNFTWKKTYDFN